MSPYDRCPLLTHVLQNAPFRSSSRQYAALAPFSLPFPALFANEIVDILAINATQRLLLYTDENQVCNPLQLTYMRADPACVCVLGECVYVIIRNDACIHTYGKE